MKTMYHSMQPGQVWLDTDGNRIEAHGGSIYYENGIYYWYGEDKSHTSKKGKIWTWGIRVYRSTDLYNWEPLGHLVPPDTENKKSLFYPTRRLDRPHLLKSERTGKYVLWIKYCDKFHFAILIADTLLGPYTVVNPYLRPYGHKAGDFDLAVDQSTGDGYIYYEADHNALIAARLNADYTDVVGEPVRVYENQRPPLTREGVTHIERNGKHYLITSGMTGYVPNPSETAVADDWLGPFTVLGNPHENDTSSASFNSQPCDIFQIAGTEQLVLMADRWVPEYVVTKERYDSLYRAIYSNYNRSVKASFRDRIDMFHSPLMGSADTSKATYVWLPIDWNGDIPVVRWQDEWTIS